MKVVVISGCNRGVGYGIAQAFAEHDYKVVGLNRTFSHEKWVDEIECDITKKEHIESSIDEVMKRYGRIDILVDNAGIRRFSNISTISDEDWEASLNTNLTGPLRLIKKTTKALSDSNGLLFL